MGKQTYRCIGIMTGNSLDAVDIVLTEFCDTKIRDICGHTKIIPSEIGNSFRQLKFMLSHNDGDIEKIARSPDFDFQKLHNDYIRLVADTVNEMIEKNRLDKKTIDIIGFHGQTCAHQPPSIAQSKSPEQIYTLQIGSGQMLADLTGIPVAFDFRSDDLMNLGEAAPLAPVHNRHIARDLLAKDIFPVAFLNGGNTGNIAIISKEQISGKEIVLGWDVGPCNHFIDYLTRQEKNEPCDFDGQYGKLGKINLNLLKTLFNKSVCTQNGENFITRRPPKSSDPAWYKIIPELLSDNIAFVDKIRTAEYFSAYIFAYNLSLLPAHIQKPEYYLIFGGGWKNPVLLKDFKDILRGKMPVLAGHEDNFNAVRCADPKVEWSDAYGYSGQYMEARIFADMAKCLLTQEPFSFPETTGCLTPTIGGIIAYPGGNNMQLWSRAAKGWHLKQKQ